MIYGSGRDNNVAQIARLLARIHVFPLIGGGAGLRAPVHVDDLAQVALAAAAASPMSNPVHVPGGERLTFREVVRRIAIAANIRYTEIPMPSLPFALGGRYLANVGRLGGSLAACVRMSQDLTVPDDAALFGVHRRGFYPDAKAIGRAE
jgi:nucleoside-diphosphate-sugar epimerase